MKTLFFDETGPLIKYGHGVLHIADLNPELETSLSALQSH